MANVLLAWELGGGTLHFVNLQPLALGLEAAGHKVFAALRHLDKGPDLLGGKAVTFLQAPYKSDLPRNVIPLARTFPQILHNIGFGDTAELALRVEAWRRLIDSVAPELIVFDHSPTALLAARGVKARRVLLGDCFCAPPDCSPFPDLRPWLPADREALFRSEENVLENVNCVLRSCGLPPLERLGQLYGEVDEVILTTLAEFDHYPARRNPKFQIRNPKQTGNPNYIGISKDESPKREESGPAVCNSHSSFCNSQSPPRYRGPWLPEGGERPVWPRGSGKKIFAYLKRFPALPQLLALLRQAASPTIVHIDGITAEFERQHASPALRFQAHRLDLPRAAAECDLAILNGTHGSTVLTLLAGKPILQLPLLLEQELNARTTVRLGAGASMSPGRGESLAAALSRVLQSQEWAEAARRFALRYAQHCPAEESRRAVAEFSRSCRARSGVWEAIRKAGKRGVGCGQAQRRPTAFPRLVVGLRCA